MPYVPPWLNVTPEFFLQAAEAGARTGTQLASISAREEAARRSADIASNAAAIRAQSAENVAAIRANQAQQEAAEAIRQAQAKQASLEQYRGLLEENRQRDDERAAAQLMLQQQAGELAGQRLGFQEQTAEQRANAPKFMRVGNQLVAVDPRTQEASELFKGYPTGSMGALAQALHLSEGGGARTNAPAMHGGPAPAAQSGGLQEGARVRSRSTGRTGTVVNGQIQWDPEPPKPIQPNVYRDLPGALPTPGGGSMYAGENLPILTDIGAR